MDLSSAEKTYSNSLVYDEKFGDADLDGSVTIKDATYVQMYVGKLVDNFHNI